MAAYNFFAFYTASKQGKTGLTVTVDVYGPAGAEVTGAAATEVGGGLYKYTHTDATDGDYTAVFKTADATVDMQHVPALAATPVWETSTRTITMPAETIGAILTGTTVAARRGDTLTIPFVDLGSLVGRSKLWMTIKREKYDRDSEAVMVLEESAGLTIVNGASHATTTDGTVTVTDAVSGDVTIVVKPAVTAIWMSGHRDPERLWYDVQMLTAAGVVITLSAGVFNLYADVSRMVS